MNLVVYLAAAAALAGLGVAGYFAVVVNRASPGNARMVELMTAIQQGARAFLRREYQWVAGFVVIMTVLIFTLLDYGRPWGAIAYLAGAVLSAVAGFVGMTIATRANARTAHAAIDGAHRRSDGVREARAGHRTRLVEHEGEAHGRLRALERGLRRELEEDERLFRALREESLVPEPPLEVERAACAELAPGRLRGVRGGRTHRRRRGVAIADVDGRDLARRLSCESPFGCHRVHGRPHAQHPGERAHGERRDLHRTVHVASYGRFVTKIFLAREMSLPPRQTRRSRICSCR